MRVSGEAHGLGVITVSSCSAHGNPPTIGSAPAPPPPPAPTSGLPSSPSATSTRTASHHPSYTSNTLRPPPPRSPSTAFRPLPCRPPTACATTPRVRARCRSGVLASDGARGRTAAGYRGWPALPGIGGGTHRFGALAIGRDAATKAATDRIRRFGGVFNEHVAFAATERTPRADAERTPRADAERTPSGRRADAARADAARADAEPTPSGR